MEVDYGREFHLWLYDVIVWCKIGVVVGESKLNSCHKFFADFPNMAFNHNIFNGLYN